MADEKTIAEITSKIKVGLERIETTECGVSNTAQAMKSGTLPVFATPAMIGLMEQAASNLAEILLPEGWTQDERGAYIGNAFRNESKSAGDCRLGG